MSFVICISLFCMESTAFIPGMCVAEVAVVMNMKKQIGRLLIATSLIQIPFGDVNPAFAALPQIDGVQVDTYSYPYIHTSIHACTHTYLCSYMPTCRCSQIISIGGGLWRSPLGHRSKRRLQ